MFKSFLDSYYTFIVNFDIVVKKKQFHLSYQKFYLITSKNNFNPIKVLFNNFYLGNFMINMFLLFSNKKIKIKPFNFENILVCSNFKIKFNYYLIRDNWLNLIENNYFYFLNSKNMFMKIRKGE